MSGTFNSEDKGTCRVMYLYSSGLTLHTGQLEPGDLATLHCQLQAISAKWVDFGLQLGVRMSTLEEIKVEYQSRPSDCLRQTLSDWLGNTLPPPTWEDIAVALESDTVREKRMAGDIRTKHFPKKDTGTTVSGKISTVLMI